MDFSVLNVRLDEEVCTTTSFSAGYGGLYAALALFRESGPSSVVIYQGNIVFTSPVNGRAIYINSSDPSLYSIDRPVVITGVAREYLILRYTGTGIEFIQCQNLKGLSVRESALVVRQSAAEPFAAIGAAGENLSPTAALYSAEGVQIAAAGAGAVFGAMKLKGIISSRSLAPERVKSRSLFMHYLKKNGCSGLVKLGDKYGWLPVGHFSGEHDLRTYHLMTGEAAECADPYAFRLKSDNELYGPGLQEIAMLGSGHEIFSLERVRRLSEACFDSGVSVDAAFTNLSGSYEEQLASIRKLASSRVVAYSPFTVDGLVLRYDVRSAGSLAVFTTYRESILPYADMLFGLSKRYKPETVGMVSAYLRVISHGLMAYGITPFDMIPLHLVPLRYIPDIQFLIRLVLRSFRIKGKDIFSAGLASINLYDSFNPPAEFPVYFIHEVGLPGYNDNLKYSILMDAYHDELDRIVRRAESKSVKQNS